MQYVVALRARKADVIMGFSCGRNVDANIKSYKEAAAYNQLTRTSLSRFCNRFNIDCFDLLQDLFIKKAKIFKSNQCFSFYLKLKSKNSKANASIIFWKILFQICDV